MNTSSMQIYCILQKRQGHFHFSRISTLKFGKKGRQLFLHNGNRMIGMEVEQGSDELIEVFVVFMKGGELEYRHPLFFQCFFLFLGGGAPDLFEFLDPVMHLQSVFGKR